MYNIQTNHKLIIKNNLLVKLISFIFFSVLICNTAYSQNLPISYNQSDMKIAFMFAMPEEAEALKALNVKLDWKNDIGYKVATFKYKQHPCVAIITGVGKSLSAGGAVLAIEKYAPNVIINVGSAGGINCKVGSIVLSQSALFHDVDLGSIHLEKYKLPDLPKVITCKHNLIEAFNLKQKINKNINICDGLVISSDQFLHRAAYYKELLKSLPQARATEMEAGSIAAICSRANCDYLFIKKITNEADNNIDNRFNDEILNFKDKVGDILLSILN